MRRIDDRASLYGLARIVSQRPYTRMGRTRTSTMHTCRYPPGSRLNQLHALLALLLMVGGLASCRDGRGENAILGEVNDDRGVRRVEFQGLPHSHGPMGVAPHSQFELGGRGNEESSEFDPRGALLTATQQQTGEIVVGDHQRLAYFDTTGRLIRVAGRGGRGPGEFTSIRDLCPQHDSTLLVIDDDGRWSLWSNSGEHIRTMARVGFVPPRACGPNGQVLVQVPGAGESVLRVDVRRLVPTMLFRIDGSTSTSFGSLPGSEPFGQIFFEPGYALTNESLIVADPRTFTIREISLNTASTITSWTVKGGLRPLERREWDSLNQLMVPRNATQAQRSRMLSAVERLGKPEVYPGFYHLLRDPAGRLWLSVYFANGEWLVIDGAGSRISRVRLPYDPDSRPMLVGFANGGAIIKHLDVDGGAHLSVHRLTEQ